MIKRVLRVAGVLAIVVISDGKAPHAAARLASQTPRPIAPVASVTPHTRVGQAPHPETTRAAGPLEVGRMPRTREQAVRLARWCVVEDACVLWPKGVGSPRFPNCGTGGELSSECKAIIEVAVNNRKFIHKTWDDALEFMSPRIMGEGEPKSTRSAWIKELASDGSDPPASWRDCRDHDPCDGDWRLYGEAWTTFRENVISYWIDGPMDVCEGEPLAEGTEADAARVAIRLRGFDRYECEGVERLWIGGTPLRPKTLSAEIASGGHQ
jgi:hypothetical protein